jgi:probable rRNA maturation factor
MTIETVLEDDRWQAHDLAGLALLAADAALVHVGLTPADWDVSVLGCSDDRIAALNADFRTKPVPTNVLSWPSEERGADHPGAVPELPAKSGAPDDSQLGDIAISYDTCLREARQANKPMDAHVTHLVVHAVLHLLGYDHISDEDAHLMEGLETEILALLGQEDPYRAD